VCFASRDAVLGKAEDPHDPHPAFERHPNDASNPDVLAWLPDALAVDADVARLDQSLRKRPAFD
jgi:hypothetical protein